MPPASTPVIPTLDDRDLIVAWQDHNDPAALNALIARHLPRLKAWTRRAHQRLHREDLINEGVIALIEAARSFSPDHPTSFEAHIIPILRNRVLSATAEFSTPVAIPERQIRDALAGRLKQSRAEAILAALQTEPLSDEVVYDSAPASEEEMLAQERRRLSRKALATALRGLTREERRLIVHHLLKEDKSLAPLAADLNISLGRARNLEERALAKMRYTLIQHGFLVADL